MSETVQLEETVTPTYGVELERTFTTVCGYPHAVDDDYFLGLQQVKQSRGEVTHLKRIGDTIVGVYTPDGEEALDNARTLGESATGPIAQEAGGLNRLHEIISLELRDVLGTLATENAAVLDMANHPLAPIDDETYNATVVPKPIYAYLRQVRGWRHQVGINGRSQNSPSTGVSAERAVDAFNAVTGLGAGFIALYANSPFEQGRVTGMQESRLTMWDEMFRHAHAAADRRLTQPPDAPLNTLRDYFNWMFQPDTRMYALAVEGRGANVKDAGKLAVAFNNPSLYEFLQAESWPGHIHGTDERVTITPAMRHLAMHQSRQYASARIRYGLSDEPFEVAEFLAAMRGTGREVEALLAQKGAYFYIEGRDPGANYPTQKLLDEAGEDVAASVLISAAALQTGIIRNAEKVRAFVEQCGWNNLMSLRTMAMRHGMQAAYGSLSAKAVCDRTLELAAEALSPDEQWMLAYPEFVLRTGKNGAMRAIADFDRQNQNSEAARIRAVIRNRLAIDVAVSLRTTGALAT